MPPEAGRFLVGCYKAIHLLWVVGLGTIAFIFVAYFGSKVEEFKMANKGVPKSEQQVPKGGMAALVIAVVSFIAYSLALRGL